MGWARRRLFESVDRDTSSRWCMGMFGRINKLRRRAHHVPNILTNLLIKR